MIQYKFRTSRALHESMMYRTVKGKTMKHYESNLWNIISITYGGRRHVLHNKKHVSDVSEKSPNPESRITSAIFTFYCTQGGASLLYCMFQKKKISANFEVFSLVFSPFLVFLFEVIFVFCFYIVMLYRTQGTWKEHGNRSDPSVQRNLQKKNFSSNSSSTSTTALYLV